MVSGGRKDAAYIAKICEHHIDIISKEKKEPLVDLVIFDGASNVQKAGSIDHHPAAKWFLAVCMALSVALLRCSCGGASWYETCSSKKGIFPNVDNTKFVLTVGL